ncbi:MAG: hypothetical protein R3F49_06015 [Planctomycetota bacterium]
MTKVFVYNGGANNEGKAGDMFVTGAQGWIFAQMGLLSATGKPPTVVGNDLKQGGTTVGRVLRDANNAIIGYESADGTQRAYNVDTSATTLQAWNALSNTGRFVIAKHGQDGGGGITLDGGRMYDGFKEAGGAGMGTGQGNPAGPYPLPPKPGGAVMVDVNGCYSNVDPPGPGGKVTSSADGVGGVAPGSTGNDGIVYKGTGIGLGGSAAAQQRAIDKLEAAAKIAGFKDDMDNGDYGTWLASLPFATQYSTVETTISGTGATFSLDYSKDQSCNSPGTGGGCYYAPVAVLDGTGGVISYRVAPGFPGMELQVPPGSLGTAREAVQLTPVIRPDAQVPRGTEPGSYLAAVHAYGEDPTLQFDPIFPAQLLIELDPTAPIVGVFEVLPSGALAPYPAAVQPNLAMIPVQRDGVYVVLIDALGTIYCNANPNSTGQPGRLDASGSPFVADNHVAFLASGLPPSSFGFVIVSPNQAFVPFAGGSQGNLCVGLPVGRGVGGVIFNTGTSGTGAARANLAQIPQPNGPVPVLPGDTYHFQAWHRDSVGGLSTSNFTDAVSITFL